MPIHLTSQELTALPTSGAAFERAKTAATRLIAGSPSLADQESQHDTSTLAAALIGAKGDAALTSKARSAIDAAVAYQFPSSCRTLAVARNVCSYLCAAAVLDYRPAHVVSWARSIVDRSFPSGARMGMDTLRKSAGGDPSNWGAHARASFAAAAAYLGDEDMLDFIEEAMTSFLAGNYDPYWKFGDDLSWHPDRARPTCLVRQGATINGHPVGGVIPDDQRRAGSFAWPPPRTNYAWEGLQGTVTATLILLHAGRDLTGVGNDALFRAYDWLIDVADHPASGDDLFQPWLVNYLYSKGLLVAQPTSGPGKCMAWTDWTHAVRLIDPPPPPVDPCKALQDKLDKIRYEAFRTNAKCDTRMKLIKAILG